MNDARKFQKFFLKIYVVEIILRLSKLVVKSTHVPLPGNVTGDPGN